MNPIKTPQEMLLELANIPRMADGRQVVKAGTELSKLVDAAIQKYIRMYKKNPPPEDIKALQAHVSAISQKPTIWTDPATQARARHELATKPGLINPEDVRDPFLTQAMVGRSTRGTRQAPFVADINDPNLQKSLESKQMSGMLENLVNAENVPSTTPAADALAKISTGLEQKALSSGKVPLIDQLKLDFFKKNKRYPSDEELEVMIAEFNPLRHQYGPSGASIVTSRPPTAKGMADWRSKARAEGVPEVYLQKPPTDYPNYLQAELDIAKGVQPAVRPSPEDLIKNPDRDYADGRSVAPMSPKEMEAMMASRGARPSRLDRIVQGLSVPFAASSGYMAGEKLAEGAYRDAALHGLTAAGLGMSAVPKYMKPGLGVAGVASAPLSIDEAVRRYEQGDRTGAVMSAIQAITSAAQAYPPLAIPATGVGMGVAIADAMRNRPDYSVMKDFK
jgi:hypothetical protein